MAHHESTEAAMAVPEALPAVAAEADPGFNFWLFGLLLGIAALVVIQNLWLRRRAQAEKNKS